MIIGIDASRAFLLKRTGIEEYSYQVIKHLRNELAEERVVLYVRKGEAEDGRWKMEDRGNYRDFKLPNTWEVKELWGPKLWTQGRLALEMLFRPVDTLFVPAHTVPWVHPKKTVVTIHGLEYEFCPEAYSWWERVYMRWSIRNSCRWASCIIAVSENTKRDLMRLYGVPEEKITVVYEGVGGRELGMRNKELGIKNKELGSNPGRLSSVFNLPSSKPYFLFIGRIEARKNVVRMIEAFDLFKKKCGTNHQLVLAGKPGYGYERIKNQELKIKHIDNVINVGYVSEEEKWELLRNADGFLFPSLYEGFGLPVLEAQSVGIPVLTSDTSSLPEVSGADSAVLVDPLSVEDIARGIEKIALDSDFRSAIIENGQENVRRFSWEKCAKEVSEILLNG